MSFWKFLMLLPFLWGFSLRQAGAMELREADITTVKNVVERNEGSGAMPAKVNDKIKENSKVSTAAASMAELTFADSSITRMGANTQFSFQSKERLVKLDQGTVLIHTPPGNGGATVDCGGVTAAVTGTTFMASHDVSGNVMFVLLEGQGGLKVTAGGTSTIIRPGQAASIGADAKKDVSNQDLGGANGPAPSASSGPSDEKGGENGGPSTKAGTGGSAGENGSAGPSSPAAGSASKIQVFDVDVKKVVSTTPLIVEFKKELPSISKIENVIEVQQTKVQEGKLEKTETEVVLIKHEDGDILVGAPKVALEDTVVVNRKEDAAAAANGGKENLDVETAAGPGAGMANASGGQAQAVSPLPAMVATPLSPPNPIILPVVDPGQNSRVVPASTPIALTVRVDDRSRFFGEINPAFDFTVVAGSLLPGHRLVSDFLTSATSASGVSGGPYSVAFSNPRIVDSTGNDVTSRYNLTTIEGLLNVLRAPRDLSSVSLPSRLTGSTGPLLALGQSGTVTYSVLESDGRASVDALGNVTVGKILGADKFTLQANVAADSNYESAQQNWTVGIDRNVSAIQGANPLRRLVYLPKANDLASFDEFFYFTDKVAGYSAGPSAFFSKAGIGDTDRTLISPGAPISLRLDQPWDFYAARKFTALSGTLTVAPSAGKSETAFYASAVDLGNSDPRWQGLVNPRLDGTSLGYRYLNQNSDYWPTFLSVIDSVSGEPYGFMDSNGSSYFPLQNFPVWDDQGGMVASSTELVHVDVQGSTHWTLAAGAGGIAARGLEVAADGAVVQMLTAGDLNLKTVRVSNVGSGQPGETLVLEANGKVRIGTEASLDLNLDTHAGLAEGQQVRLEGRTDVVGNALTGSLAVVRTGDALELRNLTIRGFSEAHLERVNAMTQGVEGRVLISGSAVRDFKIKELVGVAVNADAKIQMMALDDGGQLAGEMVVEGRMPVEAKLASALAEAGETLPKETEGLMVDAQQIDLAAETLRFNNANLVAMNAITARANTVLVQNSSMTVVRNQGMINMYVQSGLVNSTYNTMTEGRVNFAGANTFRIGSMSFSITDQASLTAAYGNGLVDIQHNGGAPQAGKVNVLKL